MECVLGVLRPGLSGCVGRAEPSRPCASPRPRVLSNHVDARGTRAGRTVDPQEMPTKPGESPWP